MQIGILRGAIDTVAEKKKQKQNPCATKSWGNPRLLRNAYQVYYYIIQPNAFPQCIISCRHVLSKSLNVGLYVEVCVVSSPHLYLPYVQLRGDVKASPDG